MFTDGENIIRHCKAVVEDHNGLLKSEAISLINEYEFRIKELNEVAASATKCLHEEEVENDRLSALADEQARKIQRYELLISQIRERYPEQPFAGLYRLLELCEHADKAEAEEK